jgi:hypothetical protein
VPYYRRSTEGVQVGIIPVASRLSCPRWSYKVAWRYNGAAFKLSCAYPAATDSRIYVLLAHKKHALAR